MSGRSALPVLVDTDVGSDVDDVLALGLVLASPEVDLVAVTTVGRHGGIRARVAGAFLGLAGRRDVDVCVGAERPCLRHESRFNWFDHEKACIADAEAAPASGEPGPERIVRAARERPGLELVAIGPMTTVARALALDPELPKRVRGLTIMGGHVREVRIGRHRCDPGIDYNLCADPEASVSVLGAGFRTTLVTADVTLRTWLRDADVERLEAGGPVARELARQVRIWRPVQHRIFPAIGGELEPDNAAFLHDPLTVLALYDQAPFTFEELAIVPTIQAGILRTLEAEPSSGLGVPMRVATGVDPVAAARTIARRLASL
ncbi:MAG: nucleoside hydrolase [Myxococcota bacterium]|nr:nucleoside hydrolase [Myxococcota bacterium]